MAAETKFTPGPWVRSSHGFQVLTNDRRTFIAQTHTKDKSPATEDVEGREERIANADLIAAAPEMYRALVRVEAYMNRYCPAPQSGPWPFAADEHIGGLGEVRAALAKARGEQN